MFFQVDARCPDIAKTPAEHPPRYLPLTPRANPFRAGFGICKSCTCPGYKPAKPNFCECGHHFSQHK